jgi:hypothetical protein
LIGRQKKSAPLKFERSLIHSLFLMPETPHRDEIGLPDQQVALPVIPQLLFTMTLLAVLLAVAPGGFPGNAGPEDRAEDVLDVGVEFIGHFDGAT